MLPPPAEAILAGAAPAATRYALGVDADAIVAKYRQACADAGIVPMPDDEAADRLREVWAALEGSGLAALASFGW